MKALYIFILFIIIWSIWYFYMNFLYHTDKYYSHCYITNVDDWDTVNLKCNGIELNNIRIAGIDSPDFHPWDKKQCFYDEAKKHLKSQEIIEEKENGNIIVNYKVTKDLEVDSLIKSWLPYVKVIKPIALKKKIENELKEYLK